MTPEWLHELQHRARTPFTVPAELPATDPAAEEEEVGTAVKVLAGFGGVPATLILIGALLLAGIYERPAVCTLLGAALVAVTLYLGRYPQVVFLATSIVCGYLLGVGLLYVGLWEALTTGQLAAPVAAVALITLLTTRNYFLIFVATVSLPACLIYLNLVERGIGLAPAVLLPALALLLVQLREAWLLTDSRLRPLRAGLCVSLLLGLALYRWSDYAGLFLLDADRLLLTLGLYACTLITLYVALGIRWAAILALVLLPLCWLPLLLGSAYLLLLSFHHRYFIGTALGVLGLAYFTIQYYYDLRWDLLNKSLILMASGGLLLLLYYCLHRRFPNP